MASLQVNNDSIIRRISDNFAAPRSYASEYQAPTAFIIQRRLVEQLRKEAAIKRQNVSTVCKDLVRFITDHQSGDALVVGFESQKDNPFREKSRCTLI